MEITNPIEDQKTAATTTPSATAGLTSAYQKTGFAAFGVSAVSTTGGYILSGALLPWQSQPSSALEVKFRNLVAKWRKDTQYTSSIKKMVQHPSYKEIIEMGNGVLPLLLCELIIHRDHWLVALNAITGEDPAPRDSTFDEAVHAWILWGKERGYL